MANTFQANKLNTFKKRKEITFTIRTTPDVNALYARLQDANCFSVEKVVNYAKGLVKNEIKKTL